MKRTLLLTIVLMLSATVVFGQGGMVGVFEDVAGTNCNLTDTVGGLKQYFVIHNNVLATTAVQFSAVLPVAFTGSWLSDTCAQGVCIGDTQIGANVGYGLCLSGSILVITISTFANGDTPACTLFPVTANPNVLPDPGIFSVDCAQNLHVALAHPGNVINPDGTCMCNVVPVRETTWGQIKSIYSATE